MKRMLVLLVLAGVLAAGCASPTKVTGYGDGATMAEATRKAWEDARVKLEIGGLKGYTLTDERFISYANGLAIIEFTAKPPSGKEAAPPAEPAAGQPASEPAAPLAPQ
jgi:hypothetical protein